MQPAAYDSIARFSARNVITAAFELGTPDALPVGMSSSHCGTGYPGVRCPRCGATNLRAPAKPTVEVDHTGRANCSMCGHKCMLTPRRAPVAPLLSQADAIRNQAAALA